MKREKIGILIPLLFIMTSMQQISPFDYVWYDFAKQVPIQKYSASSSSISLPCQARIGKCMIIYTLLPPQWRAEGNKLILPSSDANSITSYFVQGIGSDLTGQKIEFNVVLEMKNGYVQSSESVKPVEMTFKSFYNPYSQPLAESSLNLSQKQELLDLLTKGDYYQITNFVASALEQDSGCFEKIQYLSDILKILKNQISLNSGKIDSFQSKITSAKLTLQKYNNQREQLNRNILLTEQAKKITSKIKNLKSEQEISNKKIERYKATEEKYFSRMNEYLAKIKGQNSKKSKAVLQNQLEQVSKEIEKVKARRNQAVSDLITKKLLGAASTSSTNLEERYRYYETKKQEKLEDIEEIDADLEKKRAEIRRIKSVSMDRIYEYFEENVEIFRKEETRIEEMGVLRKTLQANSLTVESRIGLVEWQCKILLE